MAYDSFHVNGPAIISVSFYGDSGYNNLGITVDGVGVANEGHFEDINSDDSGPQVPADVQHFGQDARLRLEFVRWDETQMRRLETLILSKTIGQVRTADIGTLMKAGNHVFALKIASSARTGLSAEDPYTYPICYAENAVDFKLGTRVTRKIITVRAIPSNAGVLFTRS